MKHHVKHHAPTLERILRRHARRPDGARRTRPLGYALRPVPVHGGHASAREIAPAARAWRRPGAAKCSAAGARIRIACAKVKAEETRPARGARREGSQGGGGVAPGLLSAPSLHSFSCRCSVSRGHSPRQARQDVLRPKVAPVPGCTSASDPRRSRQRREGAPSGAPAAAPPQPSGAENIFKPRCFHLYGGRFANVGAVKTAAQSPRDPRRACRKPALLLDLEEFQEGRLYFGQSVL